MPDDYDLDTSTSIVDVLANFNFLAAFLFPIILAAAALSVLRHPHGQLDRASWANNAGLVLAFSFVAVFLIMLVLLIVKQVLSVEVPLSNETIWSTAVAGGAWLFANHKRSSDRQVYKLVGSAASTRSLIDNPEPPKDTGKPAWVRSVYTAMIGTLLFVGALHFAAAYLRERGALGEVCPSVKQAYRTAGDGADDDLISAYETCVARNALASPAKQQPPPF